VNSSPNRIFQRSVLARHSALASFCILLASTACDRQNPSTRTEAQTIATAGPALEYVRSFDVEETDDVVNVTPNVRNDPRGGFLVADPSEAQIRRYSPDGKLLWFAGRQGQGPGEFTGVTSIVRVAAGGIVAADRNGRLTFFDADARRVTRTVETKLQRVEDLEVLDDSTLLMSGVDKTGHAGPRLHVWSIPRNAVERRFFSPFLGQTSRMAATAAGFVTAALRGDTIAATFGSSDTIYFFTRDGRDAGRIPFASQHFRHAPTARGSRPITNPRERAEWVSKFDIVAGVHWLSDGTLLVMYQSIVTEQALGRRWHLLGLDRSGARRFEFHNVSPQVLGADPSGRTVLLVPPDAEAPNRWAVARLPQ
jgi:hypothetical protein